MKKRLIAMILFSLPYLNEASNPQAFLQGVEQMASALVGRTPDAKAIIPGLKTAPTKLTQTVNSQFNLPVTFSLTPSEFAQMNALTAANKLTAANLPIRMFQFPTTGVVKMMGASFPQQPLSSNNTAIGNAVFSATNPGTAFVAFYSTNQTKLDPIAAYQINVTG